MDKILKQKLIEQAKETTKKYVMILNMWVEKFYNRNKGGLVYGEERGQRKSVE